MTNLFHNPLLSSLTPDSSLDEVVEAIKAQLISVPAQTIKYAFTDQIKDGFSFSVSTDRSDPGLMASILEANSTCEQLTDFATLLNNALREQNFVVKATFEFYHEESDHEVATHKFCLQVVSPGQALFDKKGKFLRNDPDSEYRFYLTR